MISTAISIVSVLFLLILVYKSRAIVYVPNNGFAVREKLWASKSLESGIIALNGESGFQPEVLRGGFHFFIPFQNAIHFQNLITIPSGTFAYVFSRDGESLDKDQVLASNLKANDFSDAKEFLLSGGQKGIQRKILREGTYALNTALFAIFTKNSLVAIDLDDTDMLKSQYASIAANNGFEPILIKDTTTNGKFCEDGVVGVVLVKDGPSLSPNSDGSPSLFVPRVADFDSESGSESHSFFQDADAYFKLGGKRGMQLQVLTDGLYYINRLFADVTIYPKTVVNMGEVAVVLNYAGTPGSDVTGDEFSHGSLVARGSQGIQEEPLLPGKYPINPEAQTIIKVPTTNFVLCWDSDESQSKFDSTLKEVRLITKDAIEVDLPLSVVINVSAAQASRVIQRFGSVASLVTQALDPLVSSFFKNEAQVVELVNLLQTRQQIAEKAKENISQAFKSYNINLVEVLIGTPKDKSGATERILSELTNREVFNRQIDTTKAHTAVKLELANLARATASAKMAETITESELQLQIEDNKAKALLISSKAKADSMSALAVGESDKIRQIGDAEAAVAEKLVNATGGPQFRLAEIQAKAAKDAVIGASHQIVPTVVSGGNSSDPIQGMLASLLIKQIAPTESDAIQKS